MSDERMAELAYWAVLFLPGPVALLFVPLWIRDWREGRALRRETERRRNEADPSGDPRRDPGWVRK